MKSIRNRTIILDFIKPYRNLIIGSTLSLIIFTNSGLLMPWFLKIIIDKILVTAQLRDLYVLLVVIVMIYIIREIFFYISHFLTFYIAQRILFDVRTKLFKHLQSLSLRFYEKYRTGKLISNILTDVSMLQQMISASLINIVVNVLMIICIMVILFLMNTQLALICLFMVPLYYINFMYFKKHITFNSKLLREIMSEISANLAEKINGIKVIKSFAKERSENRNFVARLRPAFNKNIQINMMGVYCWIVAEIIGIIYIVTVIGLGGYKVVHDEMTIGAFVAFYSYLGMLINPVNQLSNLSTTISQGLASGNRILGLLELIPEVKESKNPIRINHIYGHITFENITFGYNEKTIIKDFTLKIKPGQKVALVGPSGSGKSTIAALALRFYDVNNGSICIDGYDLRDIDINSLRSHIGIVLQESFLFSGTIKENIRYSREDATDEEIIQAAKDANAHDFIEILENSYNTEVGENGIMLSSGQKQRIAIARTILKNPEILILDEATSSLDTISEYAVQNALDSLMQDKTTIIIAHRLSTICNADLIIVMEGGKIQQRGNHQQLIKQKGLYSNLYNQQEKEKNKYGRYNRQISLVA